MHEDTYYEEKTELPEEQKDITFDKPKDKDAELIKDLFTSTNAEDTIAAQSKQLGITFAEKPMTKTSSTETEDEQETSSLSR